MSNYIPYSWNTDSYRIDSRYVKSKISIGWRNYRKGRNVWSSINTDILDDLSITTFPANAQFAKSSSQWSNFLFDSSFSIKRHIEEPGTEAFNSEPGFELSLKVDCQRDVEGVVDPDRPYTIVYKNAWDGANLRMGIWRGSTARIEKVVEILEVPKGGSYYVQYKFLIRCKNPDIFQGGVNGEHIKRRFWLEEKNCFIASPGSKLRGVLVKTPVCWWYDKSGEMIKKPVKIVFTLMPDGETIECIKYIPRKYIKKAIEDGSFLRTDATFTPDADPENSSMDFWTQRLISNQTWNQLTTGAGTGASSSPTYGYIRMRSTTTTNRYDLLNRANFFFDTSSLSGLVDTGTIKFYIYSSANPNPPNWSSSINIYGSSSTNTIEPTVGDFQAVQTTPFATEITAGSLNTSGYNTFTLNTFGKNAVDTAGLSRFVAILSTYDLDVSTPTWSSSKNHNYRNYYAEQGSSFSPELEITTTPIINTANPAFLLLLQ